MFLLSDRNTSENLGEQEMKKKKEKKINLLTLIIIM